MTLKNQMNARGDRAAGRVGLREQQRQAARMQTGDADTVVWIPLDDLIVDERIQVRLNGLDPERVQQYATAMIAYEGWGSFPPLDVFRDPDTDELRIAGGFHRYGAVPAANLGLKAEGKFAVNEAPCYVHPGGIDEAIEFAEEDNLKHGLNLTSRDKRGIFERRMSLPDHPWTAFSNVRLAGELGVDEGTIRNWRKAISSLTSENSDLGENEGKKAPGKRLGADGREYRDTPRRKTTPKPKPIPPSPRPASTPEPVRNLDEREPAGQWDDDPRRPSVAASDPLPSDDVPTEAEEEQWMIGRLKALAGLADRHGRQGDGRILRSMAGQWAQAWRRK